MTIYKRAMIVDAAAAAVGAFKIMESIAKSSRRWKMAQGSTENEAARRGYFRMIL